VAPLPETPLGGLDQVADLADPVRRKLYRYVVGRPEPVTKDDAARACDVSRSLAAYHLDRLADTGLLAVSYERRTGRSGPGAGRPAKLYTAADVEVRVQLPPRDDELLARLLAAAIEATDSTATRDALVRVSRAEGAQVAQVAQHTGTSQRALLRELDRRGYAPVVGDDEIRLRNCPFHHLVGEHRDLVCRLNLELLDAATEGNVSLRAVLDPRADLCCVALRRVDG
jgi:predicted ArsR family transcriptional regulator